MPPSFAFYLKYLTRVKVCDRDEHLSLLHVVVKSFMLMPQGACIVKHFMAAMNFLP
jgi:hypothetical protein